MFRKPKNKFTIIADGMVVLERDNKLYGYYGECFVELPVLTKEEYQKVLDEQKKPS